MRCHVYYEVSGVMFITKWSHVYYEDVLYTLTPSLELTAPVRHHDPSIDCNMQDDHMERLTYVYFRLVNITNYRKRSSLPWLYIAKHFYTEKYTKVGKSYTADCINLHRKLHSALDEQQNIISSTEEQLRHLIS